MKPQLHSIALTGLAFALTALGYKTRRTILGYALGLSPPQNGVLVQQGLRVPMPDGITLATDLFTPDTGEQYPTILIRSPYGRPFSSNGLVSRFIAQRFAERGYNVVAQDVRGRTDSEGDWIPYVHEASDSASTIDWIVQQPWSDRSVGMWGQSYNGYVQWAAASTGTPYLKALVPTITQSFLAEEKQQSFQLDRALRWLLLLDALENPSLSRWERIGRTINASVQDRILAPAFSHLPLGTIDEVILPQAVPYYRTWMNHPDHGDAYWRAVDFRTTVSDVIAPVHLIGGWYDIFLEGLITDYKSLQKADRQPYLTIGPWTHLDNNGQWASIRHALEWFDTHLKGHTGKIRRKPVMVYIMGADRWQEYDAWPPPHSTKKLYLRTRRALSSMISKGDEEPDRYRYDPANPTPNIGGALLSSTAGARDNRMLEARPDVLTYTSEPLDQPVEIVGAPRVSLWVNSTISHTDFFARLTDVQRNGRSINISDGHIRLNDQSIPELRENGFEITIQLSPTAYQFKQWHRIRLQISSGAHPRIARNLGTGEPTSTAIRMKTADQTIYHDSTRPSHLILPISQYEEPS